MTPCSLVLSMNVSEESAVWILKHENDSYPETSVPTYHTAWRHDTEDRDVSHMTHWDGAAGAVIYEVRK
jgi:hypothetical protein